MPFPDLSVFGPGFTWGAATAAYQVEGGVAEDGRCPSIWDTFCRVPGAIDNGDTGDVACDHYHRWPEDVALMRKLGLTSYRFSIAWPRIVPGGTGAVNQAGLDFYDRLVDALLDAGIRPNATLYHWDLPQVLQDRGGWPARETAYAFAEYAAVVAARLGDRVTEWATLNEPLCSAWIGHLEGRMAPGLTDLTAAVHAGFHLHLGHGLAAQAVRAASPGEVRLGITNNLSTCEPATPADADIAAARRADGHINRWWLDPVFGRGYPADMLEVYQVDLPERPGDLATIAQPLDWLGVNYYFRQIIADDPGAVAPFTRQLPGPGPRTAMDWEVHAAGLEELLLRVSRDYGARELVVTESGAAYDDVVAPDGSVHDPERSAYLTEHIAACARAKAAGAPLTGYYVWSLLDNLEWAYGYDKRFGLVHVDYRTQRRTIKSSGHDYADLIRAHQSVFEKQAG
ncbi:beta-glucosidase [Amycolatopsis bartoniae]|uniref:Beta-glucosidase n=1 Tax=Amycolatopsis bartoniae TaxID=941986 RepID=A0A8H9IVG4_9PSEU|nr:GH1 family beta-glucosidase [Amycolatopsis bartoniae]MBB2937200.1 beta-glucosidase [Amycolatopsis bartoniae]TVS99001.1 beta-glucosidase [Amycolatopsis bartoniae]GHF53208.1 beta-glucosidase [Amycolatopsis bartoniae]